MNGITLCILGLALGLRLYGISFGLPALNDPDELMFELGAIRMISHHTLNPGWFGHPATTTMYALALVNGAVLGTGRLMGWFPSVKAFADAVYLNPGWVILPGRWVMALFGMGSVWGTYRLTNRLFDRPTAWIAALVLAVNPVAVVWAQVVRSDIMASFFMLLALDAALRVAREPDPARSRRDLGWGALWLALAVASKWPFGLAGLAMAGSLWIAVRQGRLAASAGLLRLGLFGALSLVFLVAISPYLLLAHDTVLHDLHGEAQLQHLGATGGTPLENAWWYLQGPLLRGFGVVAGVLALIGLAAMVRLRETRLMLLPLMAGFALVTCIQHLIWERWALPLMPLLAIAVALGIRTLVQALPRQRPIAQALMALAAALPLVVADAAQAQGRLHDTRQIASRWALEHVPAGSQILVEHFGFDLLSHGWTILFPLGSAGCINAHDILMGHVDHAKIESDRGGQAVVDYGTMPPAAAAATCHPDYAIISQYDRYAAERSRFPAEYQAYRGLIARGTVVATIAPVPGQSAGPVIRILHFDRPRP
ncbi:ArnT family glycosyltransferase [Novosphingobium terrae]|uniref:ArnT family glycosyltransferase n=1 Tax=Novosphingobium terrae TaxID=2726189 RepID=UPI00197E50BC|nr:glycosyltransferase family 39 protein [Novosphingobium terrae]